MQFVATQNPVSVTFTVYRNYYYCECLAPIRAPCMPSGPLKQLHADRLCFADTGGVYVPSGDQIGGHLVLLVGECGTCSATALSMPLWSGIRAGKATPPVAGYDMSNPTDQYWIAKNSWGTGWGLKGYFWIKMTQDAYGLCGM